jgi:hypothetical protein
MNDRGFLGPVSVIKITGKENQHLGLQDYLESSFREIHSAALGV